MKKGYKSQLKQAQDRYGGKDSANRGAVDTFDNIKDKAARDVRKTAGKAARFTIEQGRNLLQRRRISPAEYRARAQKARQSPQAAKRKLILKRAQDSRAFTQRQQIKMRIYNQNLPLANSPKTPQAAQNIPPAKAGSAPKIKNPKAKPGLKTKQRGQIFKEKPGPKAGKALPKTRGAKKQAQKAAREARKEAVKRTAQAAKFTVKMLVKAVKIMIEAAAKLVTTMIAAIGGGAALIAVIVIVAVIAALVASPFGLLFSDQDQSADTTPISQVARDLNGQQAAKADSIIQDHSYVDSVQMHEIGGDNWHDILAIFAVKTTTDPQNGKDVVTIDYARIDLLNAVFWDMVTTDYYVESIYHPGESDGDSGWTEYILHITVTRKTAAEQMQAYSFTADQKSIVEELLCGDYDEYLDTLLAGSNAPGGGSYPPGEITVVNEGIYIWPSPVSQRITSYFGGRPNPSTGVPDNHTGIDIGAAYGTPVLAAADGVVITAKYDYDGYGIYMVIDHGNGQHTLYGHMSSRVVGAGATVSQGEVIGYVGSTGWSTGPHIHFETRINGTKVDPLDYFSGY